MIRIIDGKKYYPVSREMEFNLDSLRCKLLNQLDEARENGSWQDQDQLQKQVDEVESLFIDAFFCGYLEGKRYARAKELVVYRKALRDEIVAEARRARA
jgi:hypothetical protein